MGLRIHLPAITLIHLSRQEWLIAQKFIPFRLQLLAVAIPHILHLPSHRQTSSSSRTMAARQISEPASTTPSLGDVSSEMYVQYTYSRTIIYAHYRWRCDKPTSYCEDAGIEQSTSCSKKRLKKIKIDNLKATLSYTLGWLTCLCSKYYLNTVLAGLWNLNAAAVGHIRSGLPLRFLVGSVIHGRSGRTVLDIQMINTLVAGKTWKTSSRHIVGSTARHT